MHDSLTPLAKRFLLEFGKKETKQSSAVLTVSPLVSDVARWYEKLRNAMENHEEEIIIRSAIERILKRRLIFEKKGPAVAAPLIRELLWAKYFEDNTISEKLITEVGSKIDLYLELFNAVNKEHKVRKETLYNWFIEVLSADLASILHPDHENELMANFMYHILKKKILIRNESEETTDVQIFIAVRRSFLKEDQAMLRFNLFLQYFGELKSSNLEQISKDFLDGYKNIEKSWEYPLKNSIFSFVKKQTPPFLILREVLYSHKNNVDALFENAEKFDKEILASCQKHYNIIMKRVKRALIRSIIFLFCTKVLIAIGVEGSYERLFYGQINYLPLVVNILAPPLLMVLAIFFIRPPGEKNSERILEIIHSIFTDADISKIRPKLLDKDHRPGRLYPFFMSIWFIMAFMVIGAMISTLTFLGMHVLSQILFVFFMATASFLAYRINQSSNVYRAYDERQNILGVLFDFLFMPFIYLGRRFAESVSKFNIFLLVFDFLIEMPVKSIFAFSEEWLLFLRNQKEKMN